MVCPMCVGAAVAQTAPVIVAAVSGATAAKLAFRKHFDRKLSANPTRPLHPASGKGSCHCLEAGMIEEMLLPVQKPDQGLECSTLAQILPVLKSGTTEQKICCVTETNTSRRGRVFAS